jgi:hypothetical protein
MARVGEGKGPGGSYRGGVTTRASGGGSRLVQQWANRDWGERTGDERRGQGNTIEEGQFRQNERGNQGRKKRGKRDMSGGREKQGEGRQ